MVKMTKASNKVTEASRPHCSAPALQKIPEQLHRPNIPPPHIFPSCCPRPFPARARQQLHRRNISRPTNPLPAATPHSSSRPPAAHQTISPSQSTPNPYIPFLLPPPVCKFLPSSSPPSSSPSSSTTPIYPHPPHFLPAAASHFLLPLSSSSPGSSNTSIYPNPYIPFVMPPLLPARALQQFAKQLRRLNLPPPPTFPFCCHPPYQFPLSSTLPDSSTAPIYPRLLHPLPAAAAPPSSSRPPTARQATPPPQSTPTRYTPLLLPPPLLIPALQ